MSEITQSLRAEAKNMSLVTFVSEDKRSSQCLSLYFGLKDTT